MNLTQVGLSIAAKIETSSSFGRSLMVSLGPSSSSLASSRSTTTLTTISRTSLRASFASAIVLLFEALVEKRGFWLSCFRNLTEGAIRLSCVALGVEKREKERESERVRWRKGFSFRWLDRLCRRRGEKKSEKQLTHSREKREREKKKLDDDNGQRR